MKRSLTCLFIAATVLFVGHDQSAARGPRGGGGGGARMGGGGMSRPSPSFGGGGMSRPSPSFGGGGMGQFGGSRPSVGGGNFGGGSRPNISGGNFGGATRPSVGGGNIGSGATRPGGIGSNVPGGGRPSAGDLDRFLDVPRPGTGAIGQGGAGVAGRPAGAAADFLQNGGARPGQLPNAGDRFPNAGNNLPNAGDRFPNAGNNLPNAGNRFPNAGEARQNFANNRPDRIQDRGERQQDRQQRRDEVRDQIRDNYPRLDFWSDHPNWAAWRINAPYRWATWAALGAWCGYAGEPVYYNYGESVYYDNGQVYQNDQPVASAADYDQQAANLAATGDGVSPDSGEWMPLGVFALTQDGQASGSTPTIFMQLAINKDAVISGTMKNETTGQSQTLEGAADKASQRAAWNVAGQDRPIIETGLSNLTQDTAPALIHFADGQTQQWLLVRLNEPTQSE